MFSCDVLFKDGRIEPQFESASDGVPASWCGHTFTPQERRDLEAGRDIHIDGAVSKAGKVFSCDVAYEQREDGKMGIVPKFDRR